MSSEVSRSQVISILAAHRTQWEAFDVKSLALFGSVARDEAGPDSDVDLLVEFRGRAIFDGYMGLLEYLEALLGRELDLITARGLPAALRAGVTQELIAIG